MHLIIAAAVVIVFIVLFLSVFTTSKAYSFKHTVDRIENNPHLNQQNTDDIQDGTRDLKKPHSNE